MYISGIHASKTFTSMVMYFCISISPWSYKVGQMHLDNFVTPSNLTISVVTILLNACEKGSSSNPCWNGEHFVFLKVSICGCETTLNWVKPRKYKVALHVQSHNCKKYAIQFNVLLYGYLWGKERFGCNAKRSI